MNQSLAFGREYEMTRWVEKGVQQLVGRKKSDFVAREVRGAVGIVDLVAIRFDWEAVEQRIGARVDPIVQPLRVRTLMATPEGRGLRTSTLARRLHRRGDALTRSTIRPLVEQGYLEMSGDCIRRSGTWRPVVRSLIAIELKRAKWRSALRQADNAQISADRAWVVLDHQKARPAQSSRDLFHGYGVGLASVDRTGDIYVHIRPRRSRSKTWYRAWMGELVWERWLQESLPSVQEPSIGSIPQHRG